MKIKKELKFLISYRNHKGGSQMEIELNLYEKVYNGGLGTCHVLQKKSGGCLGKVYLFYSEDNSQHFIVSEGVCGTKDGCSFHYTRYFTSLENAIKEFKGIK